MPVDEAQVTRGATIWWSKDTDSVYIYDSELKTRVEFTKQQARGLADRLLWLSRHADEDK